MILYFTGTGNSYRVAQLLSEGALERDKMGELVTFMRTGDPVNPDNKRLVLVFPVYSWGIPPIVLHFVATAAISKDTDIIAVMTCGDETGKAPEMLQKAVEARDLSVAAMWSVQMPNNYVLLPGFNVDNKDLERSKLAALPARVEHIGKCIAERKYETDCVEGPWPRLKTKLVYPLFKRWGIFPKKWWTTSGCISCKKCAEVCPVGNITMVDGTPKWGKNCLSCLACYHICPIHAVQYGKQTRLKGQYQSFVRRTVGINKKLR